MTHKHTNICLASQRSSSEKPGLIPGSLSLKYSCENTWPLVANVKLCVNVVLPSSFQHSLRVSLKLNPKSMISTGSGKVSMGQVYENEFLSTSNEALWLYYFWILRHCLPVTAINFLCPYVFSISILPCLGNNSKTVFLIRLLSFIQIAQREKRLRHYLFSGRIFTSFSLLGPDWMETINDQLQLKHVVQLKK